MSTFSAFQLDCEAAIQQVARAARLKVTRTEFVDPLDRDAAGIKLIAGNFAFWLYNDGAQLDNGATQHRFEVESYRSLGELQIHYLQEVETLVNRAREH